MAKLSIMKREEKREKLVAKYAKKYGELKAVINDAKRSDDERYAARLELQKLPRNANPMAPSVRLVLAVARSVSWPSRVTSLVSSRPAGNRHDLEFYI